MNEISQSSATRCKRRSIGNYSLDITIGSGTFGKVKLASHDLTGAQVAVKILEKQRIVETADIERVSREIHILKLLKHPHVIQLYQIVETQKQLYLVMEYASGGELFDYIVSKKRLDPEESCRFFRQIISGLEHIHSKGVAHRDLKPENLLLDGNRNIKIVDFGLSNMFDRNQLLSTACGSPCYASPEMIAGKAYDPRKSDIWAAGIILFAMSCGYLPFEDKSTPKLYSKITAGDFDIPKFIPDTLRSLLRSMLCVDPLKRYSIEMIKESSWYRDTLKPSSFTTLSGCGLKACKSCWLQPVGSTTGELDQDVIAALSRYEFPLDYVIKCLKMNKHNHATTVYYLLLLQKLNNGGPTRRTAPETFSMATPVVRPYIPDALPPRIPHATLPIPFSKAPAVRRPLAPSAASARVMHRERLSPTVSTFRGRSDNRVSSVSLTGSYTSRPLSISPGISLFRTASISPAVHPVVGRLQQSSRYTSRESGRSHVPYGRTVAVKAPFGSTSRRLDIFTPRSTSASRPVMGRAVLPFSINRPFATPISSVRPRPASSRLHVAEQKPDPPAASVRREWSKGTVVRPLQTAGSSRLR